MNSKDLGADVVFSWPGAQIGIMAARQAVGIVHGRRLREDGSLSRDDLADAYTSEHLTAPAAAASGWVDEVIDPQDSRENLAWALRSLRGR
jgi:acetyl-CoA carboxylase carboxyltransferase component